MATTVDIQIVIGGPPINIAAFLIRQGHRATPTVRDWVVRRRGQHVDDAPKRGREAFVIEAARVLKPGGRMLVVDWSKPPRRRKLFRLHRHGHVDRDVIAGLLENQGFAVSATGDVGMKKLRYLVARRVAG